MDIMSRISLRPFSVSDADDFLAWAGDDQVTRFLRWKTVETREQAVLFLGKLMDFANHWFRAICLDGRPIGHISVWSELGRDERCRAQVSYALAREYWGQGIFTFALKEVVQKVFGELPELVRLEALVMEDNIASQKVLQKVGFLREGLLRKYRSRNGEFIDMIMYSFLSTDQVPNS